MIMMSAFPVSFLLPKFQAGILASISCLFDASSLVFSIFLQMNIHFGFTRKQLFVSYAFLSLVVLIPPICMWSEMEKLILGDTDADGKGEKDQDNVSSSDYDAREKQVFDDMEEISLGSVVGDENANRTGGNQHSSSKAEFVPVHQRDFIGQIKSFEFLFVMLFASMQMLKANTYLGGVVGLLDSYGDKEVGHYYSKVFSFVLPAGIVCVPFIDKSINSLGLVGSLTLTTLIGLAFSGLAIIPDLNWQIGTFAAFTIFRAFLYAVMSTFNAQIFGLETLGRITGVVFTSSSVMGLLQYPLIDITNSYFHGDYKYLLFFLCILTAPTLVLIAVFRCHRNEYYGEIVVRSPSSSIQGSPRFATRPGRGNSLGVDVLTKSPGRSGGFALWAGVKNMEETSSLLENPMDGVGSAYHAMEDHRNPRIVYNSINADEVKSNTMGSALNGSD